MLHKDPPHPSPESCAQDTTRAPSAYLMSSYVSPRSGLKGLPVLSHWEATAETAKAATDWKQPQASEGVVTMRTCEPRAGVAPRHALGVTSQSPAGNACETTELPGKCCLSPTTSSKPQKAGTLPSPTPVGACPAGRLSHMCTHSHGTVVLKGPKRGQLPAPHPPAAPQAQPTGGQDHTRGECACGKCLGRWAGQLPKVSVSCSGPAPRHPTAEGQGPCPHVASHIKSRF